MLLLAFGFPRESERNESATKNANENEIIQGEKCKELVVTFISYRKKGVNCIALISKR